MFMWQTHDRRLWPGVHIMFVSPSFFSITYGPEKRIDKAEPGIGIKTSPG